MGTQIGLEIGENVGVLETPDDGLQGRGDQFDHRMLRQRPALIDEERDRRSP